MNHQGHRIRTLLYFLGGISWTATIVKAANYLEERVIARQKAIREEL